MYSTMLYPSVLFLSAALTSVRAHDGHSHSARRSLPNTWYHPEDHPINALFRRDGGMSTDGQTYATVGSDEWTAKYPDPTKTPDSSTLPQAWVDALNAAVAAGKIPSFDPSTLNENGAPVYDDNLDPNGDTVCSATYKCRIDDQLWDAPDGVVGLSFDDGPLPASDTLYSFLQQNNVHATHFFIGSNVYWYPNEFMTAYQTLEDDLAVHTWTHPYMTTKTNEEVLGELGWTMQIIHDSSGGRVPRFWRPPYGDTDARVTAIAKEVFGMTTVIWNQDSEDWSMSTGATTLPAVVSDLSSWYNGTKSPGLVILEHELTDDTVSAFMTTFPLAQAAGWNFQSVAQLDGTNTPYQNADGSTGAPTLASDIALAVAASSTDSASGSSETATASSGSSASKASGSGATSTVKSSASASSGSSAASSASSSSDNVTSGAVSSSRVGLGVCMASALLGMLLL